MSTATLSFRYKDGRDWTGMPLSVFRGLRSGDAWLLCDGLEVVAEYKVDGEPRGYICGLPKWVEHYRAKGFKAYSFAEAVDWIKEHRPGLLEGVCPELAGDAEVVFEGSRLERVEETDQKGPWDNEAASASDQVG